YCAQRGLAQINRFEFYLAFCYFRMAAILQGVKKRALEGNASNPEKAMQLAEHVPALASAGIQAAEGR
ncbi:phosphotransferase family protein, partial [Paracoccaceae bacterium]|nr:phosphotransferase family protein [Paracoccaceae bacterium]